MHASGVVKEDLEYDISILIPPNTSYRQFYISRIKKLLFLLGHVDQDYFSGLNCWTFYNILETSEIVMKRLFEG